MFCEHCLRGQELPAHAAVSDSGRLPRPMLRNATVYLWSQISSEISGNNSLRRVFCVTQKLQTEVSHNTEAPKSSACWGRGGTVRELGCTPALLPALCQCLCALLVWVQNQQAPWQQNSRNLRKHQELPVWISRNRGKSEGDGAEN